MYDLWVIKCEGEFDYQQQSICDSDNMGKSAILNKPSSYEHSLNKIIERTTTNTISNLTINIRTRTYIKLTRPKP